MDFSAGIDYTVLVADHLSFLISDEALKLFNHFTALFDIRIAFFSPAGRELAVGLGRSWCSYCSLLRTKLGDDALCAQSDRNGRERALESRGLFCYRCHGGLMEAVKPIYAGEELLGFVMIGQVRAETPFPADKAERWAKRSGEADETGAAGPGSLELAWESVPHHPRARLDHILHLFSSLTDLIVSRHMVSVLGRHPLDAVRERMEAHPEEPMTLADAAGLVGRSVDRTAHLFTEVYGKSFKALQKELRMKRAAELLAAGSKSLGIKEVSARCGYEDPLYFSRVFAAHYGMSPSKLRAATG